MQQTVEIGDKVFEPYLSAQTIQQRVEELAATIGEKLANQYPLFVIVLDGAFFFGADLLRHLDFAYEIAFLKIASYHGMQSSGVLDLKLGLDAAVVKGRHIVIIEDIVDTGLTLQKIQALLEPAAPASVQTVSLLFKRECLQVPVSPDWAGFEVPAHFLVGYGLDYNRQGRHFSHILKVKA